jgi:MFS family permease
MGGVQIKAAIALFVGVVFMNTAMVGASAVATLVAAEGLGAAWSGSPNAANVLGTALGALGLAVLMARRGRRAGILVGYLIGVLGALIAAFAVVSAVVPSLVLGMLLLGIGNGGAQLSRYAAADLFPRERRGFVLGSIVWGGTVGAIVGPSLIGPSAAAAASFGVPGLSAPYFVALLASVAAALAVAAMPRVATGQAKGGPGRHLSFAIFRSPSVRIALAGMVAAHFAMVAVMTMTPVHMQSHGQSLEVLGLVLSAHMLGMFALAPASGRLADRFGGRTAIVVGVVTLVVAGVLAGLAPVTHGPLLPLALFLLGYGWNLCFVGGSSFLSKELPATEQTQTEGAVDALVWSTSAVASVLSGGILASGGYALLGLVAAVVALVPLVVIAQAMWRPTSFRWATRPSGSDTERLAV